ncbi:MAG: transglycosylase SLT domain-containing protein [Sulfurimonadaceae bacterium]|jgi:membrane-bound lytic murein transglycosylase D|nr:transglycosylase SLT domain-containing protein [Sulfurimonadaceae bacterium]
MKILLTLLIPLLAFANLSNYQNEKDIATLDALDIEPSFINDKAMNNMKNNGIAICKDERFLQAMDDGYYFIPAIKNILAKNNIPAEFLYLSMAESHFLLRAYSSASASGLWQFMPFTAKKFGLRIDEYVDERRDPIKSTEAAARYLNYLHDMFGKWYLVAIAYNCGEGKLKRAIKEAGSDKLSVLLDSDKKYIPLESRMHIRKIAALALIANDESFLLKSSYEYLLNRAQAYPMATIKIPMGESLSRVASILNVPVADLQAINRHLKYDFAPVGSKEYEVYIPYIKLADFKQNYSVDESKILKAVHIVKSGENIGTISKKYGVGPKTLMSFNSLKSDKLKINQKLNIPNIGIPSALVAKSDVVHIVKKGDTLLSLAKKYKTTVASIKTKNSLTNANIKIGQKIVI